MASAIKTVGVLGTGVIGSSWIGLFLARGLRVIVADPAAGADKKLSYHLKLIWPLLQQAGLSPGASISNYKFIGTSLSSRLKDVDFIQENTPERPDIKLSVIAELDAGTRPDVVIASSSSGIPSSQFIRDCKKNGSRVLIGHPFNPPHLMPLVEIVPNQTTSEESIQTANTFYKSLGKTPIIVRQETPGFVANRLQAAINHEAFSLVARGVVTAKELDVCMTNSLGPLWAYTGPLLKDVLGGGPGGFEHLMRHVGVAAQVWLKDMHDNSYVYNEENLVVLNKSIQEMLQGVDLEKLEEERNRLMVETIKSKKDSTVLL